MILLLISSLILLWSEGKHCVISIIFKCVNVCFMAEYGLLCWIFHVSLRRMCILQLLDGVAYRCQLCPPDLSCCWVQLSSYWFPERGVPKCPTMIVYLSISPGSSTRFFLRVFDTLLLGSYTLRTLMTSWRIKKYMIM